MELRHLRYFVAVAEELHFRRAAERLHVAQPAVSQQVRRLEEELGVQLLERTQHRVCLTPAGEVLLVEGRRVLEQAARAERATIGVRDRGDGRLRIGHLPDAVPPALPRALERFVRAPPAAVEGATVGEVLMRCLLSNRRCAATSLTTRGRYVGTSRSMSMARRFAIEPG